ncbi:hypothetical protein BH11MYX2_BH11MYX2_25890 [soil metagenome]
MRTNSTLFVLTSLLAACGGGGGSGGDDTGSDAAPAKDIGFNKPTKILKANHEEPVDSDMWFELGNADLTCLNTPNADVALTEALTVSGDIKDFQSKNPNPGVKVTAYADQNADQPFDATGATSDQEAKFMLSIPAGTKRFGYKMVDREDSLDTLLLNQYVLPTERTSPHAVSDVQIVSTATATTLPALIGTSRTTGTGILAGAVRDCQHREISNFVATVSSTPATFDSKPESAVTHLDGVDTYYFSAAVGLPVRHSQQDFSNKDGLFMAIEMQPNPVAYVQVWGYITEADLAADTLSLIAQLKTSVIADTVITGSYEPLRSN